MKIQKYITIFIVLFFINTIYSNDDVRIEKAKEFFKQYVELEQKFDSSCVNLYSDNALIKNKRIYPNGQARDMIMSVEKYKILVWAAMPFAKLRGDTNTYSDDSYSIEGDGVRIKADRFSNLKKYHSPLSLLIKLSDSGKWLIYEELSESQP